MADFINEIQTIRGINYDLNAPGDATTAGDAVSTGTGGIWKRIKDKEVVINTTLTSSETIRDTMYGTDSTAGSVGTVLNTLKGLEANVAAKNTNVDTKSSVVGTKYIDLVGVDGISGKIGQFNVDLANMDVTKMQNVSNNMSSVATVAADIVNIDAVGANKTNIDFLAANATNIDVVGPNIANVNTVAGMNGEINSIVSDKIKLDSIYTDKGKLDSIYADKATIDNVDSISSEIIAVAGNNANVVSVATDLNAGVNSDVITVANDLQNANSVVKAVSANIQSPTSSINNAEANSTAAIAAKDAALASELKAADWSDKATEVETGRFSAKYWADNAAAVVGNGIINDDVVALGTTYSSYKIDQLDKAQTALISGLATASMKVVGTGSPVIANLLAQQVLPITTLLTSSDATILTTDDVNNLLIFNKNASYNIFSDITFTSSTASAVTVTIKYIDNSNSNVLTSDTIVVNIGAGNVESYKLNNLLTVGKNSIPAGPLSVRTEIAADVAGLEVTAMNSIIASSSSYELESKAINVSVTPSGSMSDTTVQAGLVTLANDAAGVQDVYTATGVVGAVKRYDKKLASLDTLEVRRTAGVIDSVRYTGDGNASAPYYRDVLTHTGADLTKVSHFYNTGDLVTASGVTTMVYNNGDLVSSSYVEA